MFLLHYFGFGIVAVMAGMSRIRSGCSSRKYHFIVFHLLPFFEEQSKKLIEANRGAITERRATFNHPPN